MPAATRGRVAAGKAEEAPRLGTTETQLPITEQSATDEIVASIAHEINQPLASIANFASACDHKLRTIDEPSLDELREWVQSIGKQAKRAVDMVRGLRRLVDHDEPLRHSVSLLELVEETRRLVTHELTENRVLLRVGLPETDNIVYVDRVQIQQVVGNLVRNACEAMTETPDSDRIVTMTADVSGNHLQFSVADLGSGIPASVRENIFMPFITSKENGIGMGLSISSRIVRNHGGRMHVDSGDDGTVVSFTIPIRGAQSD